MSNKRQRVSLGYPTLKRRLNEHRIGTLMLLFSRNPGTLNFLMKHFIGRSILLLKQTYLKRKRKKRKLVTSFVSKRPSRSGIPLLKL